jgi:hypothetical protein
VSKESESFYKIAKEIANIFGKIFASRPYIAIVDATGKVLFKEDQLNTHLEYIQNFVKANFNLLHVGDHSLPLGGVNLAFFKVSPKAIIVIYITKGFTGQLLAFRSRMQEWSPKIDELIGDVVMPSTPVQEVPETVERAQSRTATAPQSFRKLPVLTKKLDGKEKFPIEVATVLQFCDGKHSVEEICEKTNYLKVKINQILVEYQKKKWLDFKKVMT